MTDDIAALVQLACNLVVSIRFVGNVVEIRLELRTSLLDCVPYAPARSVVERSPRGDLVERSLASNAKSRRVVDPADANAR